MGSIFISKLAIVLVGIYASTPIDLRILFFLPSFLFPRRLHYQEMNAPLGAPPPPPLSYLLNSSSTFSGKEETETPVTSERENRQRGG